MAHHKSALTRIRRNARRAAINKARVSRIRTFVKAVINAVQQGDKTTAISALNAATPEIQRGVSKGVIHQNTASRKLSRLTKAVKALA